MKYISIYKPGAFEARVESRTIGGCSVTTTERFYRKLRVLNSQSSCLEYEI